MPWASAVPGAQRDVGGREAEAGAALGAADHRAGHAPPVAQHLGRALHIALRQLGPDGAGGEHLAGFRHLRHHRHAEAVRRAGTAQRLGIAGAALAEVEVVADHHMRHVQLLHQHLLDERLGGQPRQRRVEAQHDGKVEPERLQQLQLARQRRQPEVRLVGLEELARMRLEQDHAGLAAGLGRRIPGGLQQRLVPAMHAVEVADGQRRAAGLRRHVCGSVQDDHGVRHARQERRSRLSPGSTFGF